MSPSDLSAARKQVDARGVRDRFAAKRRDLGGLVNLASIERAAVLEAFDSLLDRVEALEAENARNKDLDDRWRKECQYQANRAEAAEEKIRRLEDELADLRARVS